MIDLLLFVSGLAFFVVVEAWAGARPGFTMPLWLAPFVVAALLALLIGGTLSIAPFIVHVLVQLAPSSGRSAEEIIAAISTVLGLWLVSLFLQIAQNAVRLAQGREAQPMRWIDNPFAAKR